MQLPLKKGGLAIKNKKVKIVGHMHMFISKKSWNMRLLQTEQTVSKHFRKQIKKQVVQIEFTW